MRLRGPVRVVGVWGLALGLATLSLGTVLLAPSGPPSATNLGRSSELDSAQPLSNHNPGNTSNSSGPGPILTYSVEFLENGLPMGTTWAVRLNGTSLTSSGLSLTFNNVNSGPASFQVGVPSGYVASPSSGALMVNAPLRVSVGFQTDSGGAFTFWPLAPLEIELFAVIAGLGAAAVVGAELGERWRRKRTGAGPKDPTPK